MIWQQIIVWIWQTLSFAPSDFISCPTATASGQLGDSKPFSYMTFTQLFSGGSRLGYYSAYGRRPLARTAALSGGAIDGFILGDSDSMSFLVLAGAWKGAIWSWGYLKSLHNLKQYMINGKDIFT